ncbi:copper resistance system multicopper oxidase [Spongiibacter taiwanensis]|uniref:copper resistance system multicopper oxidase n=1 Tax=Spongiibacter taiwanensis TaxID=1748242 RepID=UPI002034AF72|nr:copper resistance system multicopper oxidase [Spongiibacter taiwanensis]USA42333.1 copper resistance system multicopper oxidase [Spongiibacter taiwanensis]
MNTPAFPRLSRRRFVTGASAGLALAGLGLSLTSPKAQAKALPPVLSGNQFDLSIGYLPVNFTGADRSATAVNGSVPAPILRWKEGERVTLRVTNHLAHDSSIHWHGMILPSNMDGVPGLSFRGIAPGETYEYQFEVNQNGTYWYHSHSGWQEQTGLYGAIVIEPKDPDPVAYDRDYVVLLSDWTDEDPGDVYAKLKKMSHYYNFQERTVADLWRDIKEKGVARTWNERQMWNAMRMKQSDIADVTGYTYTFLMNGETPDSGWTGVFKRGEKVRLRFINGAAMTLFDIRIPGLKMTVVASDGQNIEPVSVDEFRIGVAETYDVVVEPSGDQAYTVFAQSMDRSGYARGTLTPDPSLTAEIPDMDYRPLLSHGDMGMAAMAGMDHGGSAAGHGNHSQHAASGGDHSGHNMGGMHHSMTGMDHGKHSMKGMDHRRHGMHASSVSDKPGPAGFGSRAEIHHAPSEFGPQVDMRAEAPQSGLHDPGVGLRDHAQRYGRKVLRYGDIRNLYPTLDRRDPEREIQIHLTGNMARYMWSLDGIRFADAEPIRLTYGERVRITLVNDTMMTHPIHLHGLWSELETGDPAAIPRKHTLLVQPGTKISYLVTADALGRWAYHCHLMYHMPGMMREVRVEQGGRGV